MKRRIRRVVNFFAFNLLFFALYLNFIHSDKANAGAPEQRTVRTTASVAGTLPVAHPGQNATVPAAATVAPSVTKASVN